MNLTKEGVGSGELVGRTGVTDSVMGNTISLSIRGGEGSRRMVRVDEVNSVH